MTLRTEPFLISAPWRDIRFFSNPIRLRITLSPLKWEMEKDHVD